MTTTAHHRHLIKIDQIVSEINSLNNDYPSRELSLVITKLEEARFWLQDAALRDPDAKTNAKS